MSKNKFVLNDTTTITQLNQFFAGLDDTTKVRARDLGEGKIELYVRKDTFKQFFTDKLRLGFLVERDYSKAVDRIKKMAAANGSTKSIKYKDEQDSAREEFGRHTHDFSASGLKGHLQHLAQHENNQLTAREALASGIPSRDDLSPELIATLTNSESIKKTQEFINSIFPSADEEKISQEIDNFFVYISGKYDLNCRLNPAAIDNEVARDFADTWLKTIEEEGKMRESHSARLEAPLLDPKLKETLTEICRSVVKYAKDQEPGSKDKQ